ncbi:MAG: hypothetical protein K0V04_05665 [Deltaproteobacteria bacterium]|nr:hypothetical protein [Deltaproteobacteria bacterium]
MRTWGRHGGVLAGFALAMVASGCADVDIIDHDPLIGAEGNVPDAIDRCGELPKGIESIEGLRTAWAMTKLPVKERSATFRVATESTLLRLSDDPFPCEAPMSAEVLTCPDAWGVDITLKTASMSPGKFVLDDYGQGYALSTAERVDGDCHREDSQGSFGPGLVEIYAVTEECVVGRLVDTADALEQSGAVVEGGFVALRCDPTL